MGRRIFDLYDHAKDIYAEASDYLGYDVLQKTMESTFEEVSDTRFAQPVLLVSGYMVYRYYVEVMRSEIPPSYLGGHSMGEITALLCGDAISFKDALFLAEKRGELMARVTAERGGTMAAVKDLNTRIVERICAEVCTSSAYVGVASLNTDMHTVITGNTEAVSKAGEACSDAGGIFIPLNITVASHCPFMDGIVGEFYEAAASVQYRTPVCPVYSCLRGQLYRGTEEMAAGLSQQMVAPVQWKNIIEDMKRRDVGVFLEAG
ncbi:MAG: ACP S-malonyltransferase, partial [Flammeovirgaceae bacterium]